MVLNFTAKALDSAGKCQFHDLIHEILLDAGWLLTTYNLKRGERARLNCFEASQISMAEMAAAAVAVQLVAPPLGEVVGFGLHESKSYFSKKIESSRQLDERYRELNQALKWLLAHEKDYDREVLRQKEKDTSNTYTLWKNKVSEIAAEVGSLINKYERDRIPKMYIWKRSNMSEKMATKLKEILQLCNDPPRDFLVDKLPEPVLKELDVPRIMGYQTLQGALEEILALLKNHRVKKIGVCGTKGVGKTTIVRNLNNNEEVAKMFDIVIFIRVPANQADHELQQRIADRLMLKRECNIDRDEVARRVQTELEKKKYLLILDEVVDDINLIRLGIPNNDNGSKVVIATEFLLVCKLNRVQRRVNVKQLSLDEAWKMFREIVSDVIDFPGIQPIARLICNKCSCLPLLINKIASSFKLKESAGSWQAGLDDLKPWPQLENQGLKELYSCLKFCYDQLKDEKKQRCFLYTSLYPADSKVYTDYLVECWTAHGFLGDVNAMTKYKKVRNRGTDVLEHLINVSLLEKGEQMIYVKMNDCIRQLALHISSEYPECSFYVESEESEDPSRLETWQHARWVSMIGRKMDCLPTNQDCSMLQTLLLQKNSELAIIPEAFFDNMSTLLVLDLHGTKVKQLPSSLSKLTSLKALYLNDCVLLTMLPSAIEKLKHLEVLDIRGTGVNFIPSYIGWLINLRCLRIPYITGGNRSRDQGYIDHDVISKLDRLEELIIEVKSYEQWCIDAESVLMQVASLENLTTFRCCFSSSEILGKFLEGSKSWRDEKQFTSFHFFVKCESSKHPKILESFEYKLTNYVKYCNGEHKDDLAINEILPRTDAFELICHKDINNLSDFVGTSSLNRIRGFWIERCNKMSAVVAGDQVADANGITSENGSLLPNLEQLYLDNLLHLKFVFRGPLHPGSFSKLHTLTIQNCPMLRRIFFKVAVEDFPELHKLIVRDCSGIEELIFCQEVTERERCVLPKMEMLILDNLSKLRSICPNNNLEWPSLERLNILKCPQLKSLPFSITNARYLKTFTGEQKWRNNLEWTEVEVQERFESLFLAST
ncbi:putative disease resistance protein [Senna tora]|uniref:Putative disease resistance protein n=1 Tax=Senna tora TaxID=362788 RepID=A0A834XDY1_9FABA|nr:putative disease resistance protein [Senna tora]